MPDACDVVETGPLEGSHAFQEVQSPLSYGPRSSLPVEVLRWLAERLAHLCPARRPGQGGTPPLPLEVRLDALGAVVLGLCQPDGTFVATLQDLRERLAEMTEVGEAVCVDGLATRAQRPGGWADQKVLYDAKRRTHTAQGVALSTIHGDLLWCDGGWPGSCHEHELLEVSGVRAVLDATGVTALVDRGFRGMAKVRARWHAPIGDRRTKDQRTPVERDHNRLQAGLRALVEQAIGQLANAWTLRRWRGLLYRVRDVYRAAAALICLGRWIHRIPT
jgi:hypothetical protein